MIKRPMLGCSEVLTLDRLREISYPVYVTEKKDGVRCLIGTATKEISEQTGATLVPYSRALKPLSNCNLWAWAQDCFSGLDGEIIIPGLPFREIQSKVCSRVTLPFPFEYHIFDHWWNGKTHKGYLQRLQMLERKLDMYGCPKAVLLRPTVAETPKQLRLMFEEVIARGGEGLIVRAPDGPYKQGRSTFKEEWMLKMKLFEDAEAETIDIEPEYENLNVQQTNELGYAKRSTHQKNLRSRERAGVIVGRDIKSGAEVRCGSGLSHAEKDEIWKNRRTIIAEHRRFTYKFHAHGIKDKPRSPIFKGWRYD